MRISKKRFSGLAALVAASAMVIAACGGSDDGAPAENSPSGIAAAGDDNSAADDTSTAADEFTDGTTMKRIADAGVFRVAVQYTAPGFGFTGLSPDPEGFDVEIAKIIAADLGLTPDQIQWSEGKDKVREEILESGDVDMVVATYTINDKRKERISFAGPYYMAGQSLMVRADNGDIESPDYFKDHPDAKVCTTTGSTPSQEIKQYVASEDQIVLFDVMTKCADALRTNQVDAVTTDNVVLMGLAAESNGQMKLVGAPFTDEPYGIGVTKGDVGFCQFIEDSLTAAEADGSYAKAWEDTAGALSPDVPTPTLPEQDTCS